MKISNMMMFLFISYVSGHSSEIFFDTINYGDGNGIITITATAVGQVYWNDGLPTEDYNERSINIYADGNVYPGFDLLDFNSGIPGEPDRTLGMGLYKIQTGIDFFYWDTRDCNLFDNVPEGIVHCSPDIKVVIDCYDQNLYQYDYGPSGEAGMDFSGDTIPVWWLDSDNNNPNYHPYHCWDETRLVLTNKYDDDNAGGLLGTDLSGIVIPSGDFDYVPKLEERTILTGISIQYQSTDIYHNNWNLEMSNKSTEMVYTPNNTVEIVANFKEKINSTLTTSTSDIPISIQDPWYVDSNGNQLNTFHELNDTENPGGSYDVFKNEGEEINPETWEYALTVPFEETAINGNPYLFSGWISADNTLEPYPNDEENILKRKVLFRGDSPQVTAHYLNLNAMEGIIARDFILGGELFISGNLVLLPGVSLILLPETIVSFFPEASLDIQGTLISDGTDGSISFDLNGSNILVSGEAAFVNTSFTGGTLTYEGENSSGSVYASSFSDASLVINEGAFTDVRNTSFTGGDVGLMTSGISSSPEITNCTFTDLDIAIRANYHSSPIIRYSTIANSGVGLEAMYSSVPNLTNGITAMRSCNTTNNVIKGCQVAVHTWHMSSPNLGHGPYRLRPWLDVSYDLLGYNYIYSNEVNFHNQGSTIYAIGNNWSGSECSYEDPWSLNGNDTLENIFWEPVLADLVPGLTISPVELYGQALNLEVRGAFEAALDLYTQVVIAVPNEKPGDLALYGMARCYKALNQEDAMILALVSISEQFEGTGVHKHAHSLLSSHKIKDGELPMLLEAEGHIHTIRTEYPNHEMEPKLLYEEFLIANKRGDGPLGRTTAGSHVQLSTKEVYHKLKENYPDSPFTFLAGLESASSKKTKTTAAVPTSFTLYPAYPNPFNPTTTIRFNIGVGDALLLHPTLTIYDITGRLVETLLNEPLTPGTHEITWNAESSSTGVYFIVLTSGNERQVQKIVLMK